MIQQSADEPVTDLESPRLDRLRSRGDLVLLLWLPTIVGCFFVAVRGPVPGVAALVLLGLLVVMFHTVIAEWRTPGAKPKGRPGLGWVSVAASFVVGVPAYLFSAILMGFSARRPGCAFPSPDGMPAYCAHPTAAEGVADFVWYATTDITALFLIVLGGLAHRSRVAAFLPFPVMVTGMLIAVDIAHFAYFLTA